MSRRACAALALLGCGLLLLATTQPWLRTVTEVAAGAPRARGTVTGSELVPWLAPVAVAAALAVVGGLAGMRWARPVAAVAALAVLAGAAQAALGASSGTGAGRISPAAVVSASRTGWLWVGVAAALVTTSATVLWSRPWSRSPGAGSGSSDDERSDGDHAAGGSSPGRGTDDPHGAEAERRRGAADWRQLSEGRDPTDSELPEGHDPTDP